MKKILLFSAIVILMQVFPSCKQKIKEKSAVKKSESSFSVRKEKQDIDIFIHSVDSLVMDPTLRNAGIGMLFLDLTRTRNRILYSFNPDLSLVPASVIKILTTATALEVLGGNKSFGTILQYNGSITGRTLKGNLFIKGGGDPTFSPEKVFDRWATSVKDLGIDTIDGNIIGDAGIFERFPIPLTWSWGELNSAYGAAASGLSIGGNIYEIKLISNLVGPYSASAGHLQPGFQELQVYNLSTEANISEENIFMIGDPYGYTKYIEGWIPKGKKEVSYYAPIPNPPGTAAYEFSKRLLQKGIYITGLPVNLANLRDTSKLKTFEGSRNNIAFAFSPSIATIVSITNQQSNNLFAEHLIKHLGLNKYHSGSDESGAMAISDFWKNRGMDTGGLYMFDGCGISRYNAVTARQLLFILEYMKKSPYFQVFYNSLPLAGVTGTLKNSFKETPAEGNLRAKTGTMSRVKSLAGYLRTETNKTIGFAIIINNYNCTTEELKEKLEHLFIHLMKL